MIESGEVSLPDLAKHLIGCMCENMPIISMVMVFKPIWSVRSCRYFPGFFLGHFWSVGSWCGSVTFDQPNTNCVVPYHLGILWWNGGGSCGYDPELWSWVTTDKSTFRACQCSFQKEATTTCRWCLPVYVLTIPSQNPFTCHKWVLKPKQEGTTDKSW